MLLLYVHPPDGPVQIQFPGTAIFSAKSKQSSGTTLTRLQPSRLVKGISKSMPTYVGCAQLSDTPLLSAQQHRSCICDMKINNSLNKTTDSRSGCRCTYTSTRRDSGFFYADICGHIQDKMPQLTPTNIASPAPVHDLTVKRFHYHLTSETRNKK